MSNILRPLTNSGKTLISNPNDAIEAIETLSNLTDEEIVEILVKEHSPVGVFDLMDLDAEGYEKLLGSVGIERLQDYVSENLDDDNEWWREMYEDKSGGEAVLLPEKGEGLFAPELREIINEIAEKKGVQFLYDLLSPHSIMKS